MRVLLIIPTSQYKLAYPQFLSSQDFPVGFAYLASALKNAGHDVRGINPNNDVNYSSAHEMLQDKISINLNEFSPDIVGIGGLCTDYWFLKDAVKIIRTKAPDLPIVIGGGIINNDAEFIFPKMNSDFCIIGEAEKAIVELVNCIACGDRDYEKIDNLGYLKDGEAKYTSRNFHYPSLDDLCFPDYEPFNIKEMIDQYSFSTRILHRYPRDNPRPMTIVTARSCPFECTFCVHHRREVKYRARSIENILEEIKQIYELYQFNILVIHDELFAVNKKRLKEFCDQLAEARAKYKWDFNWMFQTHASAALDEETLRIAKSLGCYYFSYGLESASSTVLSSMNKNTKPQQVINAVIAANNVGIGFGGNYIFGDVAETPKTIVETMKFFSDYCLDNHIHFGVIYPYPGSLIFEYCLENAIIADKLDFYQRIDENNYNMTSIPDSIWNRWVLLLDKQFKNFTWVKTVDAISLSRNITNKTNKYLVESGHELFKVNARCPYCGEVSIYNEPIKMESNESAADSEKDVNLGRFGRFRKKWNEKITSSNPFINLFTFTSFIVLEWIPLKILTSRIKRMKMFTIVEQLDTNGVRYKASFITGCRNCNKRYRISIPYDLLVKEMNAGRLDNDKQGWSSNVC